MQQLPDIEKTDSNKKLSCLSWTKYNGRGNICVIFKIDTDNPNFVVYRCRNKLNLKNNEVDLMLTETSCSEQNKFI